MTITLDGTISMIISSDTHIEGYDDLDENGKVKRRGDVLSLKGNSAKQYQVRSEPIIFIPLCRNSNKVTHSNND